MLRYEKHLNGFQNLIIIFILQRNRKSQDLERDGERQGAEDEEMMLVVRGASPSRLEEEVEKWDTREGTTLLQSPLLKMQRRF